MSLAPNFASSFILQDFFYTLGTSIFGNTWECLLFKNMLFLFNCFFKKSDALHFLPTNWLLLIVIDIFANRNCCGYCFRRFRKFPRKYANMGFVNIMLDYIHWISPHFQNTDKLSEVFYKSSCSALIHAVIKYSNFHSSAQI